MALDPAAELRELDAILGSTDDPDTKRARIARLYEEPAANDPRGLPTGAIAMGEGGAPGATGAPPGNVPDVPAEVPGSSGGFGGAGGAAQEAAPGSGGTLGMPAPEVLAQSGTSGPGNAPAGAPMPPPMAATEAQRVRPAPARVTAIPETTVKPGAKAPGAGGAVPEWLAQEMGPTERFYGRDPIGKPVTQPENAAYRSLEEEQLAQTRERHEAESQAIQAGARAEVAAVERGQIVDAELARRELERQNNLAAMERSYQEMVAEAEAEPIDSGRLWNSQSTGEKIVSKLALFIGTIGAGVAGQPNLIFNKMEADIDRDIDAQKQNRAFKLHALAAKGSLYGMARDRFGSEQAVDAAMRETAWRKIDTQLKNFHAVAQDPARKAAIEQLMAETETKIVDSERQRRLLNDADTIARMRAAAASSPAARLAKAEKSPLFVPGVGMARTEIDAKEMREELANYLTAKKNFSRARELGQGFDRGVGAFGYGTDDYHQADALSQQLITQIAKSYGGVITDADREAAKKEIPDLTAYGKGWESRLEAAERKLETNFRSRVRSKIQNASAEPEVVKE